MTELTTTRRPTPATSVGEPAAAVPTPSTEQPTLITERQVVFSTAAAVALPPAQTRRWSGMIESVAGAVRALFASSEKPARHDYPKRYSYLENALMAREMDRL